MRDPRDPPIWEAARPAAPCADRCGQAGMYGYMRKPQLPGGHAYWYCADCRARHIAETKEILARAYGSTRR
jgi:hypothetical protein